jgi:2-polyprenyl-3-methyl-5-hydroxy-6-metoxy-1,4-benzoquinol methylase
MPAHTELRERSVPGLHASLLPIIEGRVPRSVRILDCGAGSGAWLERLRAAGYADSYALDRDEGQFAGKSPFVRADLDRPFAGAVRERLGDKRFSMITGIEIIEHLEDPTHFLRECRALLETPGLLFLTSPNPESPPARLKFLMQAELRHFDGAGDPTHITPIFPRLLPRLAARAGFEIEAILPAPDARNYHGTRPWVAMTADLVCRFLRPGRPGDVNVFLLRPLV